MHRIVRDPLPSETLQQRALQSLVHEMYGSPGVHDTPESEQDAIDRAKILAKEIKEKELELRTEETVRWFSATFHIATASIAHWFFTQHLCMPPEISVLMSALSNGSIYSDRIHGFLETVKECREKALEARGRIAALFEDHPTAFPLLRSTLVDQGFDPDELEPSGLLEGLDNYVVYQDE